MNYIKLYEAYFNDSETWEQVEYSKFLSFTKGHINIVDYKYDKEFDMFDNIYNLYQMDTGDFYHNQYVLTHNYQNSYHDNKILQIHLIPKKIDIFISAYEDEWYTIVFNRYKDYSDQDYIDNRYYIVDGLEGLEDWISNNTI